MTSDIDGLCPACGGGLSRWRSAVSSEPRFGSRRYELARCDRCGSAVTLGQAPPGLHECGAYRRDAPRFHRMVQPVLRGFDRQRLAMLRPLAAPGATLLDVGTGRGRFVSSALGTGYAARGIEPSPRAADEIRSGTVDHVRVERAGIAQADIEGGSLDVVTAWHVLEHLDDPGDALQRIRGWLRPGGALLVGVPNLASAQAGLGGSRWYHLDVPRHRVHFTPAGIRSLLRMSGFEPVRTHHVLAEHNTFGMWQSLVNRATSNPSYLYNLLKRNAPVRSKDLAITALALPLAPVAALAEVLAGAVRRGGTIAVLARRL
jgi:SAM-dependent methyltransferase